MSLDGDLLAKAVSLELLAEGTYRVLRQNPALRPSVRRKLGRLAIQEQDHAALLASALAAIETGARAPAAPADPAAFARARAAAGLTRDLATVRDERAVVAVALELESALIANYHDAIGRLRDLRLVTVATQIMAAEAQHTVVVRSLETDDPALLVPGAFETGEAKIP